MNVLGDIGMIFIVVLNILFTLLGIGLIVIGAYLYAGTDIFDPSIQDLLEAIVISGLSLWQILQIIFIGVIVIGCFIVLLSCTGAFGACCKNRVLLLIYAVVVILIIIVEIFVIVVVIQFRTSLNDSLKSSLLDVLSTYEGYNSSHAVTNGWNALFVLFDCCGVNAYSTTNDFQSTTWWASRGSDVIPGYCCTGATVSSGSGLTGTSCTQTPSETTANINMGCYTSIENNLLSFGNGVIAILVVLLVLEITAVVFAFIMVWQISKDIKNRKNSKVAPVELKEVS